MEGIEVQYPVSQIDENTALITTSAEVEWAEKRASEILKSALEKYSFESLSSVIPSDTTSSQTLTLSWINQISRDLNSSKDNVLALNAVILQKILSDSYLGLAYNIITANINTKYRMVYDNNEIEDSDLEELQQVKNEVDYFNKAVGMSQLISDVIARVYAEGNCPIVLRCEKGRAPEIDLLPLSICYPSDYLNGRMSVLEFDVKEMRSRLRKTYRKTKKRKALYVEDMDHEVMENYPKAVYDAYKAGEDYAKIDAAYGVCVKIDDLGRKFGVSPLLRALRPLIVLEQIEAADVSDSQARSKKLILQTMQPDLLGPTGQVKNLDRSAFAHEQLAAAWKRDSSIYTAAPWVRDVSYIQPRSQSDDSIHQQQEYTKKMLTALGIAFTDMDSTVGSAKIGVTMLLRVINTIARNLSQALNRFYQTWVTENGHDIKFAPVIQIVNTEEMDLALRKDIASFLYTIVGGSRQTVLEYLDVDIDDERARREKENENGFDSVFYPRQTSYTSSDVTSGNQRGRPQSNLDEDKRDYDENYSKDVR